MEGNTDQEKKVSITLTVEDKPVSMLTWGEQASQNYQSISNRKISENKDEQAAIWTSMYEKNLGRKVSDLPPWIESEKADRKYGDPEKTDLASVHMQRAAESGAAHPHHIFVPTAEERRHHRKHHNHRSKRSGSNCSNTSNCDDENCSLKDTIADFHDKVSQGGEVEMNEH